MTATLEQVRLSGGDDAGSSALSQRIRVLVVDDHAAVRRGLRTLLDDEPDFQVLGVVSSAEEAMSLAEREPVDVAVVDFQLRGRNGLWVSRKLKRLPNPPRVLIYSAYADGVVTAAAVVAEADGVLNKGTLGLELCTAIRRIAAGRSLFPPLPAGVGELLRRRMDDEEQAIFGMSLAGIPRGEIARMLGISQAGLESRLSAMLRRLERVDAVAPSRAA